MRAESWYESYIRRHGEAEDFVRRNEKNLMRLYGQRYIAVLDTKVIMSSPDFDRVLRLSLSREYGNKPVLVGKIEEIANHPILIFSMS